MRKLLGPTTIAVALVFSATANASIGPTTPGSSVDSNTPGRAQDYKNTATATGAVNQLSVYLDASNTASKVELGLYRSSSRLADCVVTAPVANAWNRCTVPAVNVTQGTVYYTAILQPRGTSGVIKYRNDGSHGRTWGSASFTLSALPSSWSNGPDWGAQTGSIYANDSSATSQSSPPPTQPTDSDGDGVPDSMDQCPGTPAGTQVDSTGCAIQTPTAPPPPSSGGGSTGSNVFPTPSNTGTPAGWTPSVTRSSDMTINTDGTVIDGYWFRNGMKLTINAKNVIVKNSEFSGAWIDTDQNVLIQDSTFDRVDPESTTGEGAISYCGYTALRVKIINRTEGLRSGCPATTTIKDSFVQITPPVPCGDWHGDGFQGYTGGPSTLTNDTIDFNEGYGTSSFCGGTAPVFYPDSQGNTRLDVNHLLVSGGGESFRDGMPGNISDLQIECNTPGTDSCWHFAPIDVRCGTVTSWQATIVRVDETNWTTTKQRDQPCDTA